MFLNLAPLQKQVNRHAVKPTPKSLVSRDKNPPLCRPIIHPDHLCTTSVSYTKGARHSELVTGFSGSPDMWNPIIFKQVYTMTVITGPVSTLMPTSSTSSTPSLYFEYFLIHWKCFSKCLMFIHVYYKGGNCQIWHQLDTFDGKSWHLQLCLWQPKQANHNLFLIIRVLCLDLTRAWAPKMRNVKLQHITDLQKNTLPAFILVMYIDTLVHSASAQWLFYE